MPEDLYQTLGIQRQADKDEIQKAYRKLARKFHPDMNPNDDRARERFKRVQEAYDVLSDPQKRQAYDQYGADFEKIRDSGFRPEAAGGDAFEGLDLEQLFGGRASGGFQNGFNDFFEQLRGGGGGTRTRGPQRRPRSGQPHPERPHVGESVRYELSVPLKQALTGGSYEFPLPPTLGSQKVTVQLPAGIESGAKMRLRGKGYASPTGGPAGDLILVIRVEEHPAIKRVGKNIELLLPVTLREAMLGAKVEVPTIKGTLSLTIPAGSSGGKRLRLKGMGVDDGKGPAGDLIVELRISLPHRIEEGAKEWIEQFDRDYPLQPRANLRW